MKKINNYLLTHHPLLWNSRIVWVLLCNVVLHLLFFLAGLASISAKTISSFYGVWSVGGGSLITFSVLCSLLVIIVWLVFYLRNNAFKNFYRIGEWYLAKEFLLILLVVVTSISYFFSFNYGVKTQVRSITNKTEFVNEVNAVNRAMVYLPQNFNSYFLLNNCGNLASRGDTELVFNHTDTAYVNLTSSRNREIKAALLRPDAYSYRNYCQLFFSPFTYNGLLTKQQVANENLNRLQAKERVAVAKAIVALQTISDKYGIEYKVSVDTLTQLVFVNNNTVRYLVADQKYIDQYGRGLENELYFPRYDLTRVFDFIDECQTNPRNTEEQKTAWVITGYVALNFSILLLCYRRFSRKVFLISIVGTIVWAILVGLMSASVGEDTTFPWLLLCLCFLFLITALASMKGNSSKTFTGVVLNWHVYLVPFVVLLIVWLITDYYDDRVMYNNGNTNVEEIKKLQYPISYWVTENTTNIFLVNWFLMVAYVALLFNNWAKRWVVMAEE